MKERKKGGRKTGRSERRQAFPPYSAYSEVLKVSKYLILFLRERELRHKQG